MNEVLAVAKKMRDPPTDEPATADDVIAAFNVAATAKEGIVAPSPEATRNWLNNKVCCLYAVKRLLSVACVTLSRCMSASAARSTLLPWRCWR